GVDLLDADEHAVARVLVGESSAAFAGRDRPAGRVIRLVIDGPRRRVAEVARPPLRLAARGDVYGVGPFAVLHRGIGELRLAAHAGAVDLASGLARFRLDEYVAALV